MSRSRETIQFDSIRLRMDLAKIGTWASVRALASERNVEIGYHKYQRAREGDATPDTLAQLAKLLNFGVERYLQQRVSVKQTAIPIDGNWVALYLEQPSRKIVRTWEKLEINQHDNRIFGHYDFWKTAEVDCPPRLSVYKMRALTNGSLISGNFWVGGRQQPDGIGAFQLKIRPTHNVAEGYCSFLGDDEFLAVSHYYWIKMDGSHESSYQLRAAEDRILETAIYFQVPQS